MSSKLERVRVKHFKLLLDVDIELKDINILVGANGAGKSTLIDAILLIRDCWQSSVELALITRGQALGLLWDGINFSNKISITLDTDTFSYETVFAFSSGRFDSNVGEKLYSKQQDINLIERAVGNSSAKFSDEINSTIPQFTQYSQTKLNKPGLLAISDFPNYRIPSLEIDDFAKVFGAIWFWYVRAANVEKLKRFGSESHPSTTLMTTCDNLWSVLRNLHDRHRIDRRFDTIIGFMKEAFPSFLDLVIEQSSPMSVYAAILEKGKQNPVTAFNISDGYLQMLIHLTALFSAPQENYSLIMFDEPETSLHPWAIAVFANAVKLATKEWNRQIIIATHSPVLMSQFETDQCLVAELGDKGQTEFKRVSDMPDMEDWLNQYALGSLYMSEAIAPQSKSHLRG
jgi:predicted ATPase